MLSVQFEGICKDFGSVRVLHEVSFAIQKGEVHALIGENGAGKSTLMKILGGYYAPSAGRVLVDGQAVHFRDSREAEDLGLVLIHQEFNLAEDLSIAENIFLGRELRRGPLLDESAMNERAAAALLQVGLRLDPRRKVGTLIVAEKQLVEIAKALSRRVKLLIMDEPTATLTPDETQTLFKLIARLKAEGVTILYISHKLGEVKAISDAVTVLRDGRHVRTAPTQGLSEQEMANLMVGRELSDMFPPKTALESPKVVFRAEGVSVPGWARNVSFELHQGEILGFAGLVGAGRTELFEGILGLRPRSGGRFVLEGRPIELKGPSQALGHGIVYLSEDRKGKGLHLNMELRPNLTLMALKLYAHPLLDPSAEARAFAEAAKRFNIRGGAAESKASALSGGNQQKLALAKILHPDPKIVVLDEPTRGVDVGAKREIYFLIQTLAQEGRSVIVISSELVELIGLCHRLVVMRGGHVTGVLSQREMSEPEIIAYATGLKRSSPTPPASKEAMLQPEKPVAEKPRGRLNLLGWGPLMGLILLCIAATLLNPSFLSLDNLFNVLTRTALTGIIAVGMTFVIISGGIDLSVGSMAALIAGAMILAMNALEPRLGGGTLTVLAGMLLAVGLGALFGLLHGLTITKGRIEPFIVTLGTLGIFRAFLTYLSQGGAITLEQSLSDHYSPVYYGAFLGVPVPIWVFLAVALLGGLVLNRTRFGRYVQAIGSNEQAARYAAIKVDNIKILTYVILGVCVAVATILYVPRLGSATPSTGLLWELETIAAVIIGGTSLKGGSGRITGTVIGAILLSTIGNILNLTSIISVYLNAAVQGIVIIIAAFLQRGRR